jgi:hypothetical protein
MYEETARKQEKATRDIPESCMLQLCSSKTETIYLDLNKKPRYERKNNPTG